MGWSHISMTARYHHVVPQFRREAANRMTVALWPAETALDAATVPFE